jgi:hypothetical protein
MQSEQDQANPPPPEWETVAVHPARLAWRGAGRETCEGDIHASYSADVIASNGRVRKPFRWKDGLYVCTSISGSGLTDSGMQEHEAYRMVPAKMFTGTPANYHDKTARAEDAAAARNDPNGFYHGMTVTHSTESHSAGRRSGSPRKRRRIVPMA